MEPISVDLRKDGYQLNFLMGGLQTNFQGMFVKGLLFCLSMDTRAILV